MSTIINNFQDKNPHAFPEPFNSAIEHVLQFEGGYVNDPDDPGGETNFGISKRAYPDVDIASLTRDKAKAIYYQDYWLAINLHRVAEHLPNVAAKVFDIAVNMGVRVAGKFLQRALNKYRQHGEPKLAVDGIIGPRTLALIARQFRRCHEPKLLSSLIRQQRRRYLGIIARRPRSAKYRRGWLRRAAYRPNITVT